MNVKQLNYSLFKAAEHMAEAGKYMMVFDTEKGLKLLEEAEMFLTIIKPEEEKVTQSRLDEVLSEILSFNLEE